ncbi:MAG: MalY/PatB family protein [Aerococcus sp.]|nr:MalY/PatB family protein [Aerococcus sp.]
MDYQFEVAPNRTDTGSYKWQAMRELKPDVSEGIVPLSTADMEFEAAPEIYAGLKQFIDQPPVFGYTGATPAFFQAVQSWQRNQHDWQIDTDWIVPFGSVVDALYTGVNAFTEPGEGVIIFRPVYAPFTKVIEDSHREVVNVSLIEETGHYTIDYEAFREAASDPNNKLLIFCSPHNPVGRVWQKEELQQLADICVENDLHVVSDEIWNDFTSEETTHCTLAAINPSLAKHLVVCTSVSKTFNLAGLQCASIIVPDPDTRAIYQAEAERLRLGHVNAVGYQGTQIAYHDGLAWHEASLAVIHHNQQFVHDFFEREFPLVKAPVSEGTYCAWVDFRLLEVDSDTLLDWMVEAECFPTEGRAFGSEGEGFERLNLACPTAVLERILNQLVRVLKKHVNS